MNTIILTRLNPFTDANKRASLAIKNDFPAKAAKKLNPKNISIPRIPVNIIGVWFLLRCLASLDVISNIL